METANKFEVKRALVSVSDKEGVIEFCSQLAGLGIQILSTGGTAKAIRLAGISVTDISEFTGMPEMMDGRLKTLHPKVMGGILMRPDNPADVEDAKRMGIVPIQLVVVNLYPFEQVSRKPGVTLPELIENIDIGGPSMIRAGAKNWENVGVVVDPANYTDVLSLMMEEGGLTKEHRFTLAKLAFQNVFMHDRAVCHTLVNWEADGSLVRRMSSL